MSGRYYEKIARINLTTGIIRAEPLDSELAAKYIGGRGLADALLCREHTAAAVPLSPQNNLVITAGPLTAACAPTAGRYAICTKSPVDGMLTCSTPGGIWGEKLKLSGWDGLILEGASSDWCMLVIDGDRISLCGAEAYAGMQTGPLNRALRDVYGERCSVLSIGPAGEKQSLLAAVMNDGERASGRGGIGAVMGSKRLRAIVLLSPKRPSVPFCDADMLNASAAAVLNRLNARHRGADDVNPSRRSDTNSTSSSLHPPHEDNNDRSCKAFHNKSAGCMRCPVGCAHSIRTQRFGGKSARTDGFCGVTDPQILRECSLLCDEYGLDSVGTSDAISAAMELDRCGMLPAGIFAGVPLEWGSGSSLVEWVHQLGNPESEPAQWLSQGAENLIARCHASGNAISSSDKGSRDSSVGGTPRRDAASHDTDCMNAQAAKWAGQVRFRQDLNAVIDSLGCCQFIAPEMSAEEWSVLFFASAGLRMTCEQLMETGSRIVSLERLFNREAGMRPEEDRLQGRMLKGLPEALTAPDFRPILLNHYYEARGWRDAFPTIETLRKLGLCACTGDEPRTR